MPAFRQYLVVCLIFAVVITTDSKSVKTKPAKEYFNLCRRSDPKLGDCVKDNLNALRETLIVGIPELKLVPLDPMKIPLMELEEGGGNFRLKQKLTNLTLNGFGKFKIESLQFKINETTVGVYIDLRLPELGITSNYEMTGQILVIPMVGNGDCYFNFNDVKAVGSIIGKIVNRQNVKYIEVADVKWTIQVSGLKAHFNNLFNGDKILGEVTNNFINNNWKVAFDAYKHLPEEAFAVVFQDLTNQVFKKYSVNELFLD